VPKVTGELLARGDPGPEETGFHRHHQPNAQRGAVNEVIEQDPRAGTLVDKGTR